MPAATPATTPLADPTEATDGLLLLHVPPVDALVSVMVDPTQTDDAPEMVAGEVLTVTDRVATQVPME